ncbi:hypothetical protein HGRIS_012627 [Hohenbuehelia grisea]|uniref:Cyclin N-terminal domain-containing protein n=1 Tax=Hohenbuehelia grisea TaxID=104357 RepID=A0ABR3ISW3_9AGAR
MVDCVAETVDYAMGRPSPSSSRTRGRTTMRRPELTKFTTFVTNVITRAEITTPVYLATLVYIDRARPHLHIALEEWALERVFLGALIVASKYLNDSTLKNVHWALCTGVFGKRDVGRIEREFLDVLDFELGITEDDILVHYDGISAFALTLRSSRADYYHHQHLAVKQVATEYAVQPAKRHHTRSSAHLSVHIPSTMPELAFSSPDSASSDGSFSTASPDTPSTLNSESCSPATSPERESARTKDDSYTMAVDVAHADYIELASKSATIPTRPPVAAKKPSMFASTTMDLLRSFPIPLPPAAHHQREKGTQSRFPIRLH